MKKYEKTDKIVVIVQKGLNEDGSKNVEVIKRTVYRLGTAGEWYIKVEGQYKPLDNYYNARHTDVYIY